MSFRTRQTSAGLLAALIATGWFWSTPCIGQISADTSEIYILKGIDLRKRGRDAAALPEFQRAYEMSKSPRAAGQLGLCEHALGAWTDAQGHLVEGLQTSADPWISKNRAALEGSLRIVRQHIGTLNITGGPPGADVLVGGRSVGRLPLEHSVSVNAGYVALEIRAAGYANFHQTLPIATGQFQKEGNGWYCQWYKSLVAEPSLNQAIGIQARAVCISGTVRLP